LHDHPTIRTWRCSYLPQASAKLFRFQFLLINPALPYQQAQNSTTCSIPHKHTHTHTHIHYSVQHECILQTKLLEAHFAAKPKWKILIIITPTTTATTSLLVDVKKSHVNSSPSLRHQMQQHRDTDTQRMMISAMNAHHHWRGKKKEKKNHLMRLASTIFDEQKQNPNCDGSKICREKDFAKSGSSAWDCLLWSHYILATTQQQVGPTCRHPRYLVPW